MKQSSILYIYFLHLNETNYFIKNIFISVKYIGYKIYPPIHQYVCVCV